MKRTNLILTLSALFVLILTSPGQLLAQDTTGFDLEFVDCPEEFTVDRADSAYFHFQAVPVSNEKLCPEIHYVIVSGPGQIDSLTGWWSFYPFFEDPAPEPFYEVEVAAFFVGDTVAGEASCRFAVHVIGGSAPAYTVRIEKIHDQLQGHFTEVVVSLESLDPDYGLGGFDLLITHDPNVLEFHEAREGGLHNDCGWEYFTYRVNPFGSCDGCPPGLVRVVAIAETNNGDIHPNPDCQNTNPGFVGSVPVNLFGMKYLVANDRELYCEFSPVRFFWFDCASNVLTDFAGYHLFVSSEVYDYGNTAPIDSTIDVEFPTYQGAQEECLPPNAGIYAHDLARNVVFHNGGVDIICGGSVDAPGDININGIAYEIADAMMFARYFVEGPSAFGTHAEGSIKASDVNLDGVPLTVEDFVYLAQVVVGDALPYEKPVPSPNIAYFQTDSAAGTVTVETPDSLGAVQFVFQGDIEDVCLPQFGMQIMSHFDGENTKVFIYTLESGKFISEGIVLHCGDGYELLEVHTATHDGRPVQVAIGPAPSAAYTVRIGYVPDQLPGHFATVPVTLESIDSEQGFGGFDLLIAYDPSVASFHQALEGELYEECGWEYFTYRFNPYSDCTSCPPAAVQVVGIAETNNGTDVHPNPDCQTDNPGYVGSLPVTLFSMKYLVTNEATRLVRSTPVRFFWNTCTNNTLTGFTGEYLYISSHVYDFGSDSPISDTAGAGLPTFFGAPDECLVPSTFPPQPAVRRVDFYNGGIGIVKPDTPSAAYALKIGVDSGWEGTGVPYYMHAKLAVTLENVDRSKGLAGFDLLMAYDHAALRFLEAVEGSLLIDCGWEYFTFRGIMPDSGSPSSDWARCQVVAIAETNNGADVHPDPDCQVDTPGWIDQVPDTLCYLKFRTLHDSTTVGRFHHVRFYWQDCTDNLLTSGLVGHAGPYLYGSADVYDHGSNEPINETIGVYYPTFLGAQEECMDLPTIPDVMAPVRNVNFYNGGVEFAPDAPDRNRGDINRNGIAFEIADVVMFSFYFLNDTLAFGDHVAQSAAASDINGDGLLLTMEDFILLWRIAEGERSPDDPPPPPSQHTARFEYIPVTGQVSVYTPDTLGGVFLKFRGEPTGGCDTIAPYAPVCSYDGEFTRVFKWSAQEGQFTLEGEIMTLTGDLELVEVQTATYTGAKVNTEIIPWYTPLFALGDINGNAISFEIADWTMFSEYFTRDTLVFGDHVEESAAASDINDDGVPLTVEDFVLMVRTVLGDRVPDDPPPLPSSNTAQFEHRPESGVITVITPDSLGAVFMLFRGEPDGNLDSLTGFPATVSYDGEYTRVFMSETVLQSVVSIPPGHILTLPGDLELLEVHAATYLGARVNTEIVGPAEGEIVVRIESLPPSPPGMVATLDISLEKSLYEFGGYEMLLEYNPTHLMVTDVNEGSFFDECAWEYFTYRFGPYDNCGNACPAGFLRIVALAEHSGTPGSPTCHLPGVFPATLASVDFLVTSMVPPGTDFLPVRFIWWNDCMDNAFTNPDGTAHMVAHRVYDHDGSLIPKTDTLPNNAPQCIDPIIDFRLVNVDFYNGGVGIVPPDTPHCEPGDLNGNDVPFEIADAVAYTRYFLEGWSAFGGLDSICVTQASDVNEDGEPLTVEDLILLIRIVVGDAVPYQSPASPGGTITLAQDEVAREIHATTTDTLGIILLEFDGEVVPQPATGFTLEYHFDGTRTRTLVSAGSPFDMPAGGLLVSYGGQGTLVDADAGNYEGKFITVVLGSPTDIEPDQANGLPSDFVLGNNYPNPFNPSTNIQYDVPHSAHVELSIYNVMGQRVRTLVNTAKSPGSYTVTWDGTSEGGNRVSSGMYFYRMTAGDYAKTRKMILLK